LPIAAAFWTFLDIFGLSLTQPANNSIPKSKKQPTNNPSIIAAKLFFYQTMTAPKLITKY
jgi:hypothetical protein